MKHLSKVIWGLVLIAAATIIALNSFGFIDFDLFFDGWWTLFIIIPSFVSLVQDRDKSDGLIGLGIGVLLLLSAQEIISWDMIWKLLLPLAIAVVGIKMIISAFRKDRADRIVKQIKTEGRATQSGVAIFTGTELNFDNVVFDGADLTSIFGGVDCDLRGAIIDRDCVIKTTCVFGGIDIKVPDNVKVVNNTVCVFGGVDVKKNNLNAAHTIYIDGVCMFGGIDIK